MGSYHWKNSCDFQSLLTEFINCLQQNFPFFRSPQPLNYRESPKYYDPRYNEINSTFPFDYNIGHEEINFDSQTKNYQDRPLSNQINTNQNSNNYNPNQYSYNQ